MTFEETRKELEQMNFIELDWNAGLTVLGDFFKKNRDEAEWSQGQVGTLTGKQRSHICKAELNTSNMSFMQVVMFNCIWNKDLNQLANDVLEAVMQAPRLPSKKQVKP